VILLLVAPPGAGKGTQAGKLAAHYGIEHLSSGELLRREVEAATAIGQVVASYLERGDLAPDDVVEQVVSGRMLEAVRAGGCVLDGFPRSVHQAERTEERLADAGIADRPLAITLAVHPEELRRRLLQRGWREGRHDDSEATIDHRLERYAAETEPLLGYYAERAALIRIDGERPADEVFSAIVAAVERATRS
jgi:adenylate kinase